MERVPNLVRYLSTGSGAHGHVDVCIYGILHRLKPVDIEFMRRLGPVVNLVPVIVKCDTLKPNEISALKVSVLEEIARARIPIYGFGLQMSELLDISRQGIPGAVPFAISNHAQMTAGAENEFSQLKDAILYHHSDDLRQLTAERFVRWREARIEGDSVRIDAENRMREAQAQQMVMVQQQREERERAERMERERMDRERREREEREMAAAAQQRAAEQQLQEMIRQQEEQKRREMERNMNSVQQVSAPQQPQQLQQPYPSQNRYQQPPVTPVSAAPMTLPTPPNRATNNPNSSSNPSSSFNSLRRDLTVRPLRSRRKDSMGRRLCRLCRSRVSRAINGEGLNKLFSGSQGNVGGNDAASTHSNDGGKRGFGIIKK
ncbi:Septin-domain-containing protein [Chytridium lagenaria]|nr:Septin-domain-containing protein [Chytridium lagenaria]